MMNNIIKTDETYNIWISSLKKRYRSSQIKAAMSVNREMLLFYWNLGRDIAWMKAESRWGSKFIDTLSADLRKELPDAKGFSRTNIFYMTKFYRLYSEEIIPQVEGRFEFTEIIPQVEGQIAEIIFEIPWGHHKLIMDKCKDNRDKALFYVEKTLENN